MVSLPFPQSFAFATIKLRILFVEWQREGVLRDTRKGIERGARELTEIQKTPYRDTAQRERERHTHTQRERERERERERDRDR